MGKRWMIGLVAVVAVVAIGGIGFAAFSTAAYISGSTSAGTFGPLTWSGLVSNCTTASVTQTVNASDTLTLGDKNMAPDNYCSFSASLNNAGSIPANVYGEVTAASGGLCQYTTLFDTLSGPVQPGETTGIFMGPITVPAGGSVAYSGEFDLTTANFGLPSGVGNSAQGLSCTFTVTFSATAGD